tara:strand:+ start:124464 stop:126230 length:1767 start_codon:yes stop_codon:yes gene_type:complete
MCGILGYIAKNKIISRSDFEEYLNLLQHRGPDAYGICEFPNVLLGHRRLSIIDLKPHSDQPFKSDNYTLIYNGEIYNYKEIRDELRVEGSKFKTESDTEVLIEAYKKWGKDCVKKLLGMWSFAIYDSESRELFASRDPFGIKPFYYIDNKDFFYFSSEIKPLLKSQKKIIGNEENILNYLILNLDEHPTNTFFKNIKKLKAGHNLIIKNNKLDTYRYFNINETKNSDNLNDQIRMSIKEHLTADVEVGTCLSGGLDSSIISSIASDSVNGSFFGITAISQENDESFFAKKLASSKNLTHNIFTPTINDINENLKECLYFQEEPVGSLSIIMQYLVMKVANESKIKVLLDGQGGDEIFLGYERYYSTVLLEHLLNFSYVKLIKDIISIKRNSKLNYTQIIKYFFYFNFLSIRKIFIKNKNKGIFLKEKINRALKNDYINVKKSTKELQIKELTLEQLPHLLRYEDKNSMRFSIEARVPFVYPPITQRALSLSNNQKVHNGFSKYFLRKNFEGLLPDEVIWRKEKAGFESPENQWMNSNMDDIKEVIYNSRLLDTLVIDKGKVFQLDHRTIWRFYNLAIWEDLFNVEGLE